MYLSATIFTVDEPKAAK